MEEGPSTCDRGARDGASLGLNELRAHALITIGTAKFWLGDDSGEQDLQTALEIALAVNSPIAGTALNNLAVLASTISIEREYTLMEESRELAERMGDRDTMRFAEGNLLHDLWVMGRWDEALAGADAFILECESGSPHYLECFVRVVRATIRLGRGDVDASLDDYARARSSPVSCPIRYLARTSRPTGHRILSPRAHRGSTRSRSRRR